LLLLLLLLLEIAVDALPLNNCGPFATTVTATLKAACSCHDNKYTSLLQQIQTCYFAYHLPFR